MLRAWRTLAIAAVALLLLLFVAPPNRGGLVDRAVEDVRSGVAYAARVLPSADHDYLTALAVTTYVVGHVSAPAYGYRKEVAGESLPTSPEQALEMGAGICGEAATTAIALYDRLGVPAREVWITYSGGGHMTVEVYYAGAWHWFDPTFGFFYGPGADVESIATALAQSPAERAARYIGNDSLLWAQVVRQAGIEMQVGLALADAKRITAELVIDGEVIYRR